MKELWTHIKCPYKTFIIDLELLLCIALLCVSSLYCCRTACLSKDDPKRKYSFGSLIRRPCSTVSIKLNTTTFAQSSTSRKITHENISIMFSVRSCSGLFCSSMCCRLTDEVRDLFAGMGSSMVYSVKYRDSWVFAGAAGLNEESPFEKVWTF